MTAPKGARILDELQQMKFCSLSEPDFFCVIVPNFMKRSTARRAESEPKVWKDVQVHINGWRLFLW